MAREIVTIHVRKGAHDESRIFSFRRPSNIPLGDLLEAGMEIDGNSIVCSIDGHYDDDEGWTYPLPAIPGPKTDEVFPFLASSLSDALLETEKALSRWLDGYGYDVEFQ